MSLHKERKPMPEKKVTFKKSSNGTVYVYYTVRAYRNTAGKPTSDEVAIGKKDPLTGMLIPNARYYEFFPSDSGSRPNPVPQKTASYGNTYALFEISEEIGLAGILKRCFPQFWSELLACAFYILCQGNVMMYLEDWFDDTEVPFAKRMDDQKCSSLFAAIDRSDRDVFFREWIKLRTEREYIVYDVTSVSTHSHGIEMAEMGYNRDKEHLPQLNLGMYYGISSHLPVYYCLYSGSITDKTDLISMMTEAKDLGIENVRFVMDRGFVTDDNFKYMRDNGYSFITALPGGRLDAASLIDSAKLSIRKSANRIGEHEVYGVCVATKIYGSDIDAHIYYDPEKQVTDEKELYSHIERLRTDLEKLSKKNKMATRKYTDFFKVSESKANSMSFEPDNDKIDERLGRAGFFVLLSNEQGANSSWVLGTYRNRDVIEKSFDQLKNQLDFKRMRTHWDRTTEGKMFVGFLSLILRSYIMHMVKKDLIVKHLTIEKVLMELKKIRTVTLSDLTRCLLPITKMQRLILAGLGLSSDKMLDSFV